MAKRAKEKPVRAKSGWRSRSVKEEMRASLLALERNPRTRRTLSEFGLERFVPVTDADYSRELLARRKPG